MNAETKAPEETTMRAVLSPELNKKDVEMPVIKAQDTAATSNIFVNCWWKFSDFSW